jgi:hypothetical protein
LIVLGDRASRARQNLEEVHRMTAENLRPRRGMPGIRTIRRHLPAAAALVALGASTAVFVTPSASATKTSAPHAAFAWAPAAPVTGQAVTFDGHHTRCTAAPCRYVWTDAVDGSSLGTGAKKSFKFKDRGTKAVTLTVKDARGRSASVRHDIRVKRPPAQAAKRAPTPRSKGGRGHLTWAPPSCGDATHHCVDIKLSNTGSNQTPSLSANNDYRIRLPSVPLRGGLQIRGGHNVIVLGGQINLTVPCSDASSSCHGINIDKGTPGQVFIEGVWIHDPQSPITQSTGDGIDVADNDSAINDITLENVRIDGISGCSGGADHADVFQPFSVPDATVRIDHLTGTTNCQGLQLDPDLAWLTFHKVAKLYDVRNVNIDVLPNPYSGNGNRYAYWFTGGTNGGVEDGCGSGPIKLINVYGNEPNRTMSVNSAWPDTDQPSSCASSWSARTLSFRHSPHISGVLTEGTPAGGDFVPLGVAGVRYVSPGYK